NCELTRPDEKIVTDNVVTIVGYTDFPSRVAAQSSVLYANDVRHFIFDLPPGKDGVIVQTMGDDVIRGATVTHAGDIPFPPPPPKVKASAAAKPKEKPKELTLEEKRAKEAADFRQATRMQVSLLGIGTVLMLLAGYYAPPSFMAHFVVFMLACFVGFQ